MILDRRLLAGALSLSLALAACGGAATTSPAVTSAPASSQPTAAVTTTPATQAPASVVPSDAPTAPATTNEPASTGAAPSLMPGGAPELEAMLPSEAGGVKFTKTSFDGASLAGAGAGIDTAELGPILKANGKTIADVSMAIASPADTSGSDTSIVMAFRIRGLDAAKFMAAAGVTSSEMVPATIGGKSVLKAGAAGFSIIVYTKGDVLFEILLATDTVAAAILGQLP
jgi:hypothetical protein